MVEMVERVECFFHSTFFPLSLEALIPGGGNSRFLKGAGKTRSEIRL